jgi:hypothetical protein
MYRKDSHQPSISVGIAMHRANIARFRRESSIPNGTFMLFAPLALRQIASQCSIHEFDRFTKEWPRVSKALGRKR